MLQFWKDCFFFLFQLQLLPSKDQKLLYQLGFEDDQMLFAKVSVSGVTTVPTKEEAEVIYNWKCRCKSQMQVQNEASFGVIWKYYVYLKQVEKGQIPP